MKTTAIIEGLTILEKYRDEPDGYNCDAGHDMLSVAATDKPLEEEDLRRMVDLGWFQEDADCGDGDFEAEHYNPEESWDCFT